MTAIDPAGVAFDIDGVVADTMSLFIDIARTDYNIRHVRYQDITRYMLEECLDIDGGIITDIIGKLLDGSRDEELKPLEGAVDVLTRLGNGYGPLRFVTARPASETIERWMLKTLPLASARVDIVATGAFDAKADILLEKGVTAFVEDRVETCFLLREKGITPILFKQPWNRCDHPFIEVDGWRELASLIRFS